MIELTSHLDPQFLASIMMLLPQDARERMSKHISGKLKDQIRELLDYPEGSIGRTMTTNFVALKGNNRAEEAIEKIRSLAKRKYPSSYVYVVDEENRLIGVLNGTVIGAVTALVAWIWSGNPFLGLVIGLGMLVNLILAGLAGASIPLIMKKIGIDPAQSSSIILTTVTDGVGFIAFLGFAVLFQTYLV
jgi:Mg/Co/Ni transporter MgtE